MLCFLGGEMLICILREVVFRYIFEEMLFIIFLFLDWFFIVVNLEGVVLVDF